MLLSRVGTYTSITIIRFPEILSFLWGKSSSISSTLDEDTEGVWETENVLLLLANVAVAGVIPPPLWSDIFKLSFFDSLFTVHELIPVFTLFTSVFSLLKISSVF